MRRKNQKEAKTVDSRLRGPPDQETSAEREQGEAEGEAGVWDDFLFIFKLNGPSSLGKATQQP